MDANAEDGPHRVMLELPFLVNRFVPSFLSFPLGSKKPVGHNACKTPDLCLRGLVLRSLLLRPNIKTQAFLAALQNCSVLSQEMLICNSTSW